MIKIETMLNKGGVKINVKGTKETIALDFYSIFEAFMQTEDLDNHFKAALFAYLESNEELLNEFLKYHDNDITKEVNDIIDKIFGDDDK